jgi:hypothetical protein
MKPTGWLCIALWSISIVLSASEYDWDSAFTRQSGDFRFTGEGRYLLRLPDGWSLLHTASCALRDDSDQIDRNAQFRWQIGHSLSWGTPVLLFRADRSHEEDTSNDYAYNTDERAVGAGLEFAPLPRVNLSTRWYYARLDDTETDEPDSTCEGLLEQTDLSIERQIAGHRFRFSASDQRAGYHPDRPDYDSAELQYTAVLPRQSLQSHFSVRKDSDRLRNSSARNQYHKTLSSETDYSVNLSSLKIQLQPDLYYDENSIDGRPEKTYTYREGRLRGEVSLPFGKNVLTSGLDRDLSYKDAAVESNSEDIDCYGFDFHAIRNWAGSDSLVARYRIQLRQTDIPGDLGSTDNDQLNRELEIGAYSHWRSGTWFSLLFSRYSTRQIFLRSEMSGQNTVTRSYILQPAVEIDCGGGYYIGQMYRLRAEYEDYLFPEMGDDRLFRRFEGNWRWGYDESQGLREISITDRSLSDREGAADPLTFYADYDFTINASGLRDGEAYAIGDERFQHTAGITLKGEQHPLAWRLSGQISWVRVEHDGAHLLSRREERPELELNYPFSHDGAAFLIVQPVFYDTIHPDWRLTFRLTLHR